MTKHSLPPGPYEYITTADLNDHHGMGHVYLVDTTGKKIASIWGKPDQKLALVDMIICASGGSPIDQSAFTATGEAKKLLRAASSAAPWDNTEAPPKVAKQRIPSHRKRKLTPPEPAPEIRRYSQAKGAPRMVPNYRTGKMEPVE